MIEDNGISLTPAEILTIDEKVCLQSYCSCHVVPSVGESESRETSSELLLTERNLAELTFPSLLHLLVR